VDCRPPAEGQAAVSDGPILPGTWAYYDGLKRVDYDREAATALLKEAGYTLAGEGDVVRKNGDLALRFTLTYPDSELHRQVAEYLRDSWSALGAQVELEGLTYDQMITERLEPRSYQAGAGGYEPVAFTRSGPLPILGSGPGGCGPELYPVGSPRSQRIPGTGPHHGQYGGKGPPVP
jgi:ABC-type transport system substrate-binding protein